jgi:simple sugar transport system substrate-binding protein
VLALAAACCLLAAGCSGSGGGSDSDTGQAAASGSLKVALITHASEGDTFWNLVKKGAEAAAAKDGVQLTYANDPDAAGQATLVRDAVRDKVDGIAVTLAKPQAMKAPVAAAHAADIPVVGLNSGIDAWRQEGLLEFFGQDESLAGRAVGDKLDELKARHALCVIHERGNVALEARCAGVKKTFGGTTEIIYVDGADMNATAAVLTARLRQDATIDEVVMNGADFARTAVKSVREARSRAHVATFDLNQKLVAAVRDGDVQFAVDQQPYLQGYLAVDSLWLYRTNGNVSGGGVSPVLTGPAFVTRTNVASVAAFAARGTR